MKVKEESEKAGFKLNIQRTKIMASGPITFWQIDGEKWKQSKISFSWAPQSMQSVTAATKLKDTYSLEEKLWVLHLDSVLKNRDITLPKKVLMVKAVVFPVVMYGYESWTVKKAECWRIDAFELCCWRNSWKSLGQQGDQSSQS